MWSGLPNVVDGASMLQRVAALLTGCEASPMRRGRVRTLWRLTRLLLMGLGASRGVVGFGVEPRC